MRRIEVEGVVTVLGGWTVECKCGVTNLYTTRQAAVKCAKGGSCKHCKKHHMNKDDDGSGIYQNSDGKWCSICSSCGVEQPYSRKDHAKNSSRSNWLCRKCYPVVRDFDNKSIGDFQRTYNRFFKMAKDRGIEWRLTIDDFKNTFNGSCSLTGWDIHMDYGRGTASLDRIDNSKGYRIDNIQWVHAMVNMAKNKYTQERFIEMCKAVASNFD